MPSLACDAHDMNLMLQKNGIPRSVQHVGTVWHTVGIAVQSGANDEGPLAHQEFQ